MSTESDNIYPAVTGQDLGSPNQQWDAFLQNVNISGTLNVSGVQVNKSLPMLNVLDFGADNSGGWYVNNSIVSGSKVLSSGINNRWGSLPVAGQRIVVSGAGPAGADLVTTIGSINGQAITLTNAAATTVTNHGIYWGGDSTAAVQAAINSAQAAGGGTIYFPAGYYFVSTVTVADASGTKNGRVIFQGVGQNASVLVGIGADQSPIITTNTLPVAIRVSELGFNSYDYTNKNSIGIKIIGNQFHSIERCYFTNLYEAIRFSNTYINYILCNEIYACKTGIRFGPAFASGGTGPVTATWVSGNDFASCPNYAILNDSNNFGGSQQNYYVYNSFQNDNPPFTAAVDLNDNRSHFIVGYQEMSASTSGYWYIFRGTDNDINVRGGLTWDTGGGNRITSDRGGSLRCDGPSTIIGLRRQDLTGSAVSTCNIFSDNIQVSGLSTYEYLIGSAQDWPSGRCDVAGRPFGRSISNNLNPSAPTQFGANAVIPYGTLIANDYFRYAPAMPQSANVFWVCMANPATNPPIGSEWARIEAHTKIRQEATAAPVGGLLNYTVGDFLWNTAPSELGSAGSKYVILGWTCTVAGTPGTWVQCRTLTGN